MAALKFTNEQIIAAYKDTGSVWKAAKRLGACGQSVWERLRKLDYVMPCQNWTEEELTELKELAPQCTLGEIARRLGRPYSGVASKVSELQLGLRYGNRERTLRRGSGLTKHNTEQLTGALSLYGGSIRQFCKQRGLDIDVLVLAIQKYQPAFWDAYVRSHSDLAEKTCPQCAQTFIPLTQKQMACSRRCATNNRADKKYFGGKRAFAVGMREGICQLCERERKKLAAHHIYGKENDPENDFLIALCPGCHALVGHLAFRSDAGNKAFLENLIALSLMRKQGHKKPWGLYVEVDIEEMDESDVEEAEAS